MKAFSRIPPRMSKKLEPALPTGPSIEALVAIWSRLWFVRIFETTEQRLQSDIETVTARLIAEGEAELQSLGLRPSDRGR